MAGHAAIADPELTDVSVDEETSASADEPGSDDSSGNVDEGPRHLPPVRNIIVAAAGISVVLAGLGGWLGYRDYQAHQQQLEQQRYVAVGRQAALNLTTIDFTQVDGDVRRILDGATGTFLDDFQKRVQPFVEVVKQAKSKSVGTVTEAGLESVQGDHAQVLVAVQVKTTTDGAPAGDPRGWRMRIDVQKAGNDLKVANVQFVP